MSASSDRRTSCWWREDLVLVGLALAVAHYLLWSSAGGIASIYEDDVFYYAMIARHLAEGSWPTFDGISATTGFHPLWAVLLLPAIWLGSTSEAEASFLFALQFSWFVTTGLLILRIVGRFVDARVALLVAAWFVLDRRFYRIVLTGLGTPLLTTFLLLTAVAFEGWSRRGGAARSIALGLAVGLAFLARLEAGAVSVLVFGAVATARVPFGGRRPSELFTAMVAALVPFTAWAVGFAVPNGAMTPVSGELKRMWAAGKPAASFSDWISITTPWDSGPVPTPSGLFWCLVVLACYAAVRFLSARSAARGRGPDRPGGSAPQSGPVGSVATDALVAVGFLSALANKVAYAGHAIGYYYTAPLVVGQLVALGLVVGYLARALGGANGAPRERTDSAARLSLLRRRVATGCTAVLLCVGFVVHRPAHAAWSRAMRVHAADYDRYAAGVWMRNNLPQGTVCASFNAGIYAFFSERTLLNLDGKINSRDFFETVVRTRTSSQPAFEIELLKYLRRHRVRHLVEKDFVGENAYRWTFTAHPEVLDAIVPLARFPSRTVGMDSAVYTIDWEAIDALGVMGE